MPRNHRLRDACGGARFLDLHGLILLVPFVLVTSVLSSAPPDLASSWRWLLANTAALAATAVVVMALRALRPVFGSPAPLGVVVGVGAVLGVTKGVTTTSFATMAGLLDDPGRDVIGRGLNTAVIGAVVVPALAALLSAHDRWRAERDLLVAELARRALHHGEVAVESYRHELHDIVERTRQALIHLSPSDTSAHLRRVVDTELRPLSARALMSSTAPPMSSGRDLARVAIRYEPWPVVTVTALFTVTTWLLLVRYVSPGEAALFCAVMTAVTLCLLWLGSWLRTRFSTVGWFTLLGVIAAISGLQRPLADAVMGVVEPLRHAGIVIATALWLGQLLVGTAMFTAARRERDVVRSQLLELLGPQGIRDVTRHGVRAVEGRDIALFVHGHLQNRLMAVAQRLDSTDDDVAVQATLASVFDLLDEVSHPTEHPVTLTAHLDDMTTRWRGLATINMAVTLDEQRLTPEHVERIGHVVVEAITNAVRHGAAQHLDIEIAYRGPAVVISVTDDGFGPRRARGGTGSRYFDLASAGAWSLTAAPAGGALLQLQLSDELPA
jgi:hypothetical protein